MKREGRKRLAVELEEFLDNRMRWAAKKSWLTVSAFIHRAIAEKIVRDFGPDSLVEETKK